MAAKKKSATKSVASDVFDAALSHPRVVHLVIRKQTDADGAPLFTATAPDGAGGVTTATGTTAATAVESLTADLGAA